MKSKKYEALKRLFEQYEDGSIHQSQKEIIDDWFDQHHNGEIVDLLKEPEHEARIYNELSLRIMKPVKPVGIVRKLSQTGWFRAASIVLLAGAIAGIYYKKRDAGIDKPALAFQTYQTKNGQVQKIELEDGSVIWLNAATTLRVPTPFKQRSIYLDRGEAFFEVKHDANNPFTVTTGNFVTSDIGTSFNIRAYHPETEYRVEVASGEITVERLNSSGKPEILNRSIRQGQVLAYSAAVHKSQILLKSPELIQGWKTNGTLYLDKLTLPQIAEELSRHFNIRAIVKRPELDLHQYSINLGTMDLSTSLRELTLRTGMSYELTPNSLIINPSASNMK
ncbi:FecR family protein [Mucilaginibacter endophyticus]|uniref:FecR family protein n=1 Tax=Mucilaginibacter endophyticus TaxID=2675003 RepID=UPI000E0E026B|nr:FecR family protein [Mucilaginibacter endophyticus]